MIEVRPHSNIRTSGSLATSSTEGDDGAELEIEILARVPQGENVRQPGSDAKIGDKVLDAGVLIGSGGGEVGLLGFVGRREVSTTFPCWLTG